MIRRTIARVIRRCPTPLLYLILAALFYAPLLLGLRTFPDGDFTHHFLPFSLFQQDAIRSWQLPLWNPHTYSGHPFLADTQAAVFYPVSNLLLLLTMPWDAPGARLYWLQVEAILHIALAGWFTFLLARALTKNRWAAFIAGCCFAFSGYLTGYPPLQLAVLRTAIWLPLLLWALYRAMQESDRWRWWIGAALIYATMFFAGHPQTFLHSSYVMAAWLVWLLWGTRSTPTQPPPRAGEELRSPSPTSARIPKGILVGLRCILFFLILALGLSAAQLLPSLEFTQLSVRANVDYAYVSGGFPLQDTWQLLLPGVLTQFSPLYIGIIGLGLAFTAAAARPRWQLTINNLLLIIFLISLLLSYGDNSFLYPFFYRFAPGWNLFRGQERAAFVVALSLSLLAGLGAAALPHLTYLVRRRLAVTFAVLVSGAVYGFGVLWQLLGQTAVNQWVYLLIAILTILFALVLVICLVLPGWDSRRTWLLAGALLLNLFAANIGTNLADFDPVRKTILAPEMAALQGAVAAQPDGASGLPGRVYNEFRVYEDYAMRLDAEDVWGSSPLRLARYAALFDNFPLDRMWRLTGVDTVLTWRRELFAPSTLLAEFPQATDTTYLHRLSGSATAVNPRAWLVSQIQVADDAEAQSLLADSSIDLGQVAVLAPTLIHDNMMLAPGTQQIALTRLSPQELGVNVTTEHGGLLVISENWMPGWQIGDFQCLSAGLNPPVPCTRTTSVDALPLLKPLRVDLTLIGIVIPPGQMQFTLRYWPVSVQLGLWISGGTVLLLLLLGGIHWWRRGRAT